jgi:hypothetical protein
MPNALRVADDLRLAPRCGLPRLVIVAHPVPFNRAARNRAPQHAHQYKPERVVARGFGAERAAGAGAAAG